MPTNTQTKLLGFFLAFGLLSTAFADTVDVTADPPSGTYNSPIRLELSVTDPSAKTFYSFKPDGYPQDAFLYTGALLLRKTTPFVFFSVVNPTNESKIKINNYVFQYSSAIVFA